MGNALAVGCPDLAIVERGIGALTGAGGESGADISGSAFKKKGRARGRAYSLRLWLCFSGDRVEPRVPAMLSDWLGSFVELVTSLDRGRECCVF